MDPRAIQNESEKSRELRAIRDSMTPLFEAARSNGLCFYSTYQGIWFTAEELRKEQEKGSFNWGAANWRLRNPQERIDEAERAVASAKKQLEFVRKWAAGA